MVGGLSVRYIGAMRYNVTNILLSSRIYAIPLRVETDATLYVYNKIIPRLAYLFTSLAASTEYDPSKNSLRLFAALYTRLPG